MGSNIDLSSVIECITEQFPWNIYAIVIFGSAASAETYQKFADIDLCVLEHFFDPFLDRRLEKRLQKFPSEIAVSHYPYWYFCKLGTMLAFDVGKSGVVIYGPRNVLSPIQDVRMHPYEALKIFFNHSVVKLIICQKKTARTSCIAVQKPLRAFVQPSSFYEITTNLETWQEHEFFQDYFVQVFP
jgi:hypothetical protein